LDQQVARMEMGLSDNQQLRRVDATVDVPEQ
jgi:hypothetical protein